MLPLIGCILASSFLFILFREFARFRVSLVQVVAINYAVCVVCGLISNPDSLTEIANAQGGWLGLGVITGLVFITIFAIVGFGSQRIGVGYTAMLTKLSVVFPTLLSFFLFSDPMGTERWAGIGVALVAVVLLHLKYFGKKKEGGGGMLPEGVTPKLFIGVALALFLGAGAVDSLLRLYSGWYGGVVAFDTYLTVLFAAAALGGLSATALQAIRGKERFAVKNLVAGVVLGIPNYFSILFITMGLAEMEGTVFFPLNNIGQLLVATLAGAILYREPLPLSAILGIFVAVLAVGLIALKPLMAFLGF